MTHAQMRRAFWQWLDDERRFGSLEAAWSYFKVRFAIPQEVQL